MKMNDLVKRLNEEEKKEEHFWLEKKNKAVGITINLRRNLPLNHDVFVRLGYSEP